MLALSLLAGTAWPAGFAHGHSTESETLWRGTFRGESLCVRATWVPTARQEWCDLDARGLADDTTAIRPKYLDYRIEDGRGRVRFSDPISVPDYDLCVDQLAAAVSPWQGGLVVGIEAYGCCCEPAGYCGKSRYIYLAGGDSMATSAWTDLDWDPATPGPFGGWIDEACVQYPMALEAHLRDSSITFEPSLPHDAKEGDLLEREIYEVDCFRPGDAREPTTIELFPSPGATKPDRLVLHPSDAVTFKSAILRLQRALDGSLVPRLFRLGIEVSGRHGYVTLGSLRSAGFAGI